VSVQLDAALAYASRGRPVFPVNVVKEPLTAHGFKDATVDERTIRRWWARWPDAGIGTPTGPNWFALDDDTAGRAIAELEAEHDPLPPTVEVVTPRPGLHLYYLGRATNSAAALPAGLDVRGIGGYVVLPPSPHENGFYEWRTAPDEAPIAHAPMWLLELLGSPANGVGRGEHQTSVGLVPHGERDPYLFDIGVRLLCGRFLDRDLIASHLEHEFRRACVQSPPPTPGYFQRMAASLLRTRIADRERDLAEFAARWATPGGGHE
jgi:hypothetical protein